MDYINVNETWSKEKSWWSEEAMKGFIKKNLTCSWKIGKNYEWKWEIQNEENNVTPLTRILDFYVLQTKI